MGILVTCQCICLQNPLTSTGSNILWFDLEQRFRAAVQPRRNIRELDDEVPSTLLSQCLTASNDWS